MTDHYATLGVPRDAGHDAIKRAYRKKASSAHPDKGGSAEQMALVNRANDVLSDPARRERYDATGDDSDKAPADEAEQLLMAAFNEALDKPEGDFIQAVRRKVTGLVSQGKLSAAELRTKVCKLEKRRAATHCKSGRRNVADLVISLQLDHAKRRLCEIDCAIDVAERALKMLEDYSSDEQQRIDPWASNARFVFTAA